MTKLELLKVQVETLSKEVRELKLYARETGAYRDVHSARQKFFEEMLFHLSCDIGVVMSSLSINRKSVQSKRISQEIRVIKQR